MGAHLKQLAAHMRQVIYHTFRCLVAGLPRGGMPSVQNVHATLSVIHKGFPMTIHMKAINGKPDETTEICRPIMIARAGLLHRLQTCVLTLRCWIYVLRRRSGHIMRSIFSILCTALCVITLGATASQAQRGPTAVGVQTVDMRLLSETVPVFAEVVTARDGAVASRVAGTVETVNVLAGTRVEAGDLLVELNDELLKILLAQAEAQTAEAKAGIETARTRVDRATTTFARVEALRGSTSFSLGRFDDAQADLFEARSQFAEAEAREKSAISRVAEATYQLERSRITAPFSGVVIEVSTIPGAFIQAGTSIVRLLDTGSFEVQASVPSRYVPGLRPGQTMQASLETGEELTLELRAILPLEDPSTRTRAVRFSAPDLGEIGNIAVGQSVTVQIPVGQAREVMSVPKDALVQARGGWTVFVAADNKAQPRPVELGVALGNRYEVLSGLAPGDVVVVRGNERLRPGQDITPNPVETN
jgi:RND family efflux transporter MFP subunit